MPPFPRPCLCAFALVVAPAAAAATSESQAWMTAQVSAKVSEADTVSIDAGRRFRARTSDDEQWLGRIAIDHRIAPGVQIGGGFAYLEGRAEEEMRLFQQLTVTTGMVTARTRIEQRFFDVASQAGWRLRQRVQLAVPIDREKRWTAIVAGEAMAHLNRARPGDATGLATLRGQVGLRHAVTRAMDAQLLYMAQWQKRANRVDAVSHIPWMTLSWRI